MAEFGLYVLSNCKSQPCIYYLLLDISSQMSHRPFKNSMVKTQLINFVPTSKTFLFLCSLCQRMELLSILVFKSGIWELTLTSTLMISLEYVPSSITLCLTTLSQILISSHLNWCKDLCTSFPASILTLLHSPSQRTLLKHKLDQVIKTL